jgi:hypothetical protein
MSQVSSSNSNFDLNYLADNQPSMCIPRVFENINELQVREVFEQLDLGELDHVDIIERRSEKGEKYKRIFIHFRKWYWNDDAINARRRLIDGKDIKVVYNMPWFWKISANRWTGNSSASQRESNSIHEDIRRNVRHNGPRIEFEDHNEVRRDNIRRPIVKEEPKQTAAEIAQLEIINSTKKRRIILKKKEPQVAPVQTQTKVEDA